MGWWESIAGSSSSDKISSVAASSELLPDSQEPSSQSESSATSPAFYASTAPHNPTFLHPLAGLDRESLEYLALEDTTLTDLPGARSALPSRGWSDDLCYGTGVTYLTALTIGAAWGLAEGLQRSPPSAPPKLRLNSVLNAVTRRGPFLGNSAGVIAMVYNGLNSTIGYYRGRHDAANSIAAGALSGLLFKSTKGFRPMLTSGVMVASAAGSWTVARKALF